MADNVVSNAGSGGSTFAAAELSFSGDTAVVPGGFVGILSGSEGSWTYSLIVGGAGAVSAGTQRVTLASDDPAVAALQILDNAISGSEMQVDVVAALPAGTNNIGDVDVLSIIPGTGATNLGKAIDTATGATDTGVLALATRDDALSALTPAEGDNVQLRTNANGALWVIQSGTVTVDGSGVTQPVSHAALTELAAAINASSQMDVNIAASAATLTVASHAVTNAGTFAVQVDGSALTALQLIDDSIFTDDAAFTPGTSKVSMVGFEADETATDSVDEGDAGAARMTLDRKQIVTDYAHTAGGCSNYTALSTAAVLTAEVKGSAGQVYDIQIFNNGANEVFARLYNQTGAPGSGDAANIIWRGIVPGNAAGAGFAVTFPKGRACATGIGIRVSGAVADNDTTVLAANEVTVNLGYR